MRAYKGLVAYEVEVGPFSLFWIHDVSVVRIGSGIGRLRAVWWRSAKWSRF